MPPLCISTLFVLALDFFALISCSGFCICGLGPPLFMIGFCLPLVCLPLLWFSVSGFCFWLDSSVLDSAFSGFLLCFLGFSFVFFWPPFSTRFSASFYRLPSPSLLTSPVFAGLFSSPTRSWAIDMVHDWINFVADLQPVESGCRRRTRLFHQQRRRFGSNGFHQ